MTNKTIDYYNRNADEFCEHTAGVDMSTLYAAFLAEVPRGGKIPNFGCGSGRDSRYFLSCGGSVDAVGGPAEMCRRASALAGIEVKNMMFGQLEAESAYYGIWACASLLHLPPDTLTDVLKRLRRVLRPSGVLYASFQYGCRSEERNERYFTDMNEQRVSALLEKAGGFRTEKIWTSGDVRENKPHITWLNLLARRI